MLCLNGRIVRYSKTDRTQDMRHIDYGLAVLRADVMTRHDDGAPFDLAVVYQDLIASDELAAYEVETRFFEIGTPAGLAATRAHLMHAG